MTILKQFQIQSSNSIESTMQSARTINKERFKFESKEAFHLFQKKFGVVDGGVHLIEDHRDYGYTLVKSARKNHTCSTCGGEIAKGTSYFYGDSFCIEDDKKIWQWKFCLTCDKKEAEEHNKGVLNNESLIWEKEYAYFVALTEDSEEFHFISTI